MIAAFGPAARAYAAGVSGVDAIITEMSDIGAAYVEAVRCREIGRPFYTMVLYPEPRAHTTLAVAHHVLAQVQDLDQRRISLDRLAGGTMLVDGQPASARWIASADTRQILGEFLSLGNGVLVRSFAEAARLRELVPRLPPVEPLLVEPHVPDVAPRLGVGPGVVIWAPESTAADIAWYAFALVEFFGTVTCVTSDGAGGAGPRYLTAGDPELPEVLAAARCILCADPDDPGAAVAFARRGFGIAAPASSGVCEFVRGAETFTLATAREVEVAVRIAITRSASLRPLPVPPPAPPADALPLPVDALPLVSVLIATYNRPDDLTRCLEDLARQTYPRMEAVVVNDAGENVDAIVARFPFARIVNLPVNGGVLRLIQEGFKHLRGSYVQLLADDDTLFPDHIERLVGAMLRSGAAVAHGNTLIRYQERLANGTLRTIGFNAVIFRDSTTPSEALIATPIAGQALIYRRDIFETLGGFREDTALADQEMQLRAANRYVFAYTNQLTAEWRIREGENASATTDSAGELRKVFEALHPRPNRPFIEEHRLRSLEGVASRPKGFVFPATLRIQHPPGG